MNEQTAMGIGIAVALLAVFGGPIVYLVRHKAKIGRVWRELAESNGLQLEAGRWPSVEGEQEGRFFAMGSGVGRTSSGRASLNHVNQFYVSAEVKGDIPRGLVAGKRHRFQGKGSIQLESDAFNKSVVVECPDQGAAKAYLTPERQDALVRLAKYDGVLRGVDEDGPTVIELIRDGYKVRLDWLEERRGAFLAIAGALDAR